MPKKGSTDLDVAANGSPCSVAVRKLAAIHRLTGVSPVVRSEIAHIAAKLNSP